MEWSFQAIFIDFYGTISGGDREAVEQTCQQVVEHCELPVTPARLAVIWGKHFFDLIDQSNHDGFRTLYECEVESLRKTLAGYDRHPDPEPLVAPLEAYWRDPPIYADALKLIHALDLPVCCVSNADTAPLLAAIAKHGLQFDAVVTSESVRCYKPDAAIFRRGMELLGVDPKHAIHVGDSLHSDVGGASAVGLATAWVERDSRIHDIGTAKPDIRVRTLANLLEHIVP